MTSDNPFSLLHTLKHWSWWIELIYTRESEVTGKHCSIWWISNKSFAYRRSYVNTAQFSCKCACGCVSACHVSWCGSAGQKPLKPLILYPPLPRVSAFFEDHVAMIIKGALVPLQTCAMNMDKISVSHSRGSVRRHRIAVWTFWRTVATLQIV